MQKKVVVITGASSGIGAQAACQLHAQGARVVIVGRSEHKTKAIAKALGAPFYLADFARLDEVRTLAAQLRTDFPTIDVLVNNAGGIFGKREITVDGHEKTMQINHLAHFLLTTLLLQTLLASKASIINTSSVAHRLFSDLDIQDLQVRHNYSPLKAYGMRNWRTFYLPENFTADTMSRALPVQLFIPAMLPPILRLAQAIH